MSCAHFCQSFKAVFFLSPVCTGFRGPPKKDGIVAGAPMNYSERSLIIHEQLRGKIGVSGKMRIENLDDLSIAYTPGVAAPCLAIAKDKALARKLTIKHNSVAVVSDGSAVLGLGNIGPEAAIPVMEGKALLFKQLADIDAWPVCLDTQNTDEIVETVRRIAPVFGGINLEDIAAPRCFEVERRLQDLGIPVFHDDQHGTAIVLLAGLLNACRVTGRDMRDLRVVINGAGAAGNAITNILRDEGPGDQVMVKDIIVCDSKGAIHSGRSDLNQEKLDLLRYTNFENKSGSIQDVIVGADVFIGVSKGDLLGAADISRMAKDCMIFALANPTPEIMPEEAKKGGAAIIATGRSDFPNQVNNALAFPGIFRGALDAGAPQITDEMKLAAAFALAEMVKTPGPETILPRVLDLAVSATVAKAVYAAAKSGEVIRPAALRT
jgi:malate dehydrogenase (oxaloacetate-decarboxylating)